MSQKHTFQSGVADSGVAGECSSNEWNDEHYIDSTATVPAAGKLTPASISVGGRTMLSVVAAAVEGGQQVLQPFFGKSRPILWVANGAGVSSGFVTLGYSSPTSVGTATARAIATTNLLTRSRRLGYVSAATAGSLASLYYSGGAAIALGDGAGLGGFLKVLRFATSDAATVAGARQFCGVGSSVAAPTNVEPSTLTNVIGVGHGASDINLKIYYGGSAAQTPIDLGANFPANTLSADVYELVLFAPPTSNNSVGYKVTRLNTGHTASGTLTGTAGVALPSSTTLLSYQRCYRSNNATALAVGLDLLSDYIETPY